jgi:hypothetical protein
MASGGRRLRTALAIAGQPSLPAIGGRSAPSSASCGGRRTADGCQGGRPWGRRTCPDIRQMRTWTSGCLTTLGKTIFGTMLFKKILIINLHLYFIDPNYTCYNHRSFFSINMTLGKPTIGIHFSIHVDHHFKCFLGATILSIGNHIKGETKGKNFKSN